MSEPPDGIIVTIGEKMYGEHGYRHWLRNFLEAMKRSETDYNWFYWLRQANQPKVEYRDHLRYVYLCIGKKIRFRVFFASSTGERTIKFDGHDEPMYGKAWVAIAGPAERPPFEIKRKGFQGFRYTKQLW